MNGYPYAALCDSDGTELLILTDNSDTDPFLVSELDLGAVDVRESAADSAAADGTVDVTAYVGSRGISASLTAFGNEEGGPSYWLDRLRGLMHPSRRLFLYLQAVDWDQPRRILVRGASAPHDLTDQIATQQFQWKSPTGYLEAIVEQTVELLPASAAQPGATFPISFPFEFPQAYPSGSQPFDVDGELPSVPVIDIYGPCSGVASFTDATGRMWRSKSSLSIPAGSFWRIDPSRPSVFDSSDQPHYNAVDFSVTDWSALSLAPGRNRLVFEVASSQVGCKAIIRYRARSS